MTNTQQVALDNLSNSLDEHRILQMENNQRTTLDKLRTTLNLLLISCPEQSAIILQLEDNIVEYEMLHREEVLRYVVEELVK